jgi:hypothetical protein
MTTILLRHFPELTPILQQTANAFAPWPSPPGKNPRAPARPAH